MTDPNGQGTIIMFKLIYICICVSAVNASALEEASVLASGLVTSQDLFNTSMRDGVACYRIPALVTAVNGDLVAVMDERVTSCADLGGNKDINIVGRRSGDGGMTWSDLETIVDHEFGKSASDPSLIVDRETGELFLFYNFMDLENEADIYSLHVIKSRDHGKTWSEPEDITAQITRPEWRTDFKFITSGRGIQTRSGVLLHTLVNLQRGLHIFSSRDHGKTWDCIDTPIRPGDESKLVELADGRWMINSRVKGAGMRYVHLSADRGKSWQTAPEPALIDPACNASILRYTSTADGHDKNRLLFSNAKSKNKRKNMTVRISYDEGKTWTEGKTIYIGDAAYSSLTVLQNGDIGLLFEKDNHKENRFVRFTLEWLTDGKDRYKTPEAVGNSPLQQR